ncbi:ferredoxin [Kitasatospora purpeofusca]|uniref:ferredoxin n=1 Tax=Kitasatospora TaxID=2063 RepID=UPI0004C2366C|nr:MULTISPECIES: ferredoxin [Kitasatospora]
MHITVDRDLCCGSGNCVETVPDVFDQDSRDGMVLLRISQPPEHLREAVERAAQLCPVGAIEISHRNSTD